MSRCEVKRFACDSSAWEFSVVQDGRELVAQLFHRSERYGPEFRADNQAALQRAIARWLLLHADVAGGLH
ncbi:MAG: hypothetical protein ACREPE_11810 [Lysobacter sp.]